MIINKIFKQNFPYEKRERSICHNFVILKKIRKPFHNTLLSVMAITITALFLSSCNSNDAGKEEAKGSKTEVQKESDPYNGKGIGPVKSVELGPIDDSKAKEGEKIFDTKCGVCHNVSKKKLVGPGLSGITERRKPEWILNQILNPLEMTRKDPVAKELLATYTAQMTNQELSKDDARAVLEYFRKSDKEEKK